MKKEYFQFCLQQFWSLDLWHAETAMGEKRQRMMRPGQRRRE